MFKTYYNIMSAQRLFRVIDCPVRKLLYLSQTSPGGLAHLAYGCSGGKPLDHREHFSDLARKPGSTALAELFKLTERPDIISFAGGFPASDMFLPEEAAEVTRQLMVEEPYTVLGYSPTPGFTALRDFLAERQLHLGMPAAAGPGIWSQRLD